MNVEILLHFKLNDREIASFWSPDVPRHGELIGICLDYGEEEEPFDELYKVHRIARQYRWKKDVGELTTHVDVYLSRTTVFDLKNTGEPTGYQYVEAREAAHRFYEEDKR